MAALGWLLNLGFAASEAAEVTTETIGVESLISDTIGVACAMSDTAGVGSIITNTAGVDSEIDGATIGVESNIQ